MPTIPDAYADAVHIANTHEPVALASAPPLTAQVQTIFTPQGAFRVEVRLVPTCEPKGQQ